MDRSSARAVASSEGNRGLSTSLLSRISAVWRKLWVGWNDRFDGPRGAKWLRGQDKIELWMVWNVIQTSRDFGRISRRERGALEDLLRDAGDRLDPIARDCLHRFLASPQSAEGASPPAVAPWRGILLRKSEDEIEVTHLEVELSESEAAALAERTGIAFGAGKRTIDRSAFASASFAEVDRREDKSTPVRRWPLRIDDLTATRRMRGMTMAGTDNILQYEEIVGALRLVEARARSELTLQFHRKYPVPEGAILNYSLNVLALSGAYVEHAMIGDLPNRIVPVDNNGEPKNAAWRAFVAGHDARRAGERVTEEDLERLWLAAHMRDFDGIDDPVFQRKLTDFWLRAVFDPVLAPVAVYTKAMVLGRAEFEKMKRSGISDEVAFARSLGQFIRTMIEFRTIPFWQDLLVDIGRLVLDHRFRELNDLDDRGLPTDKALLERTMSGLREMLGLRHIVAAGIKQL